MSSQTRKWLLRIGEVLLALAILGGGIWLASHWVKTKPKAKPRVRPRMPVVVQVQDIVTTNTPVRIEAMGDVVAADMTDVQAQISGMVEWVHPDLIDGGFLTNGTLLVRMDARDYQAALMRDKSAVDIARSDLRIEQGRQASAARELGMLAAGREISDADKELALRKPQLKAAEAQLAAAQAAVARSMLDLERTEIVAPFDAKVLAADADVGDLARPGSVLARLVATHEFWIKAKVRTDQLKWLRFPESSDEDGSEVVIHTSSGGARKGRLIKLLPELEKMGRMAQVLIRVDDPLQLKSADSNTDRLLLGEFVRVRLDGIDMKEVVALPRAALRDGTKLWLLDEDKKLRIQPATVVWSNADQVYVKNDVPPGSRLIVSALSTPVEGMDLNLPDDLPPDGMEKGKSKDGPGPGKPPAKKPGPGAKS